MTPDEIAETLLNTMMPNAWQEWRYEVSGGHPFTVLTFRSRMPVLLNIKPIADCFGSAIPLTVSWQGGPSAEPDHPCIVFQGGIGGKVVQAVFALNPDR